MTTEEQEVLNQLAALVPPKGYEKLHQVFQQAIDQAAHGKGKERHASGEPFEEQPICSITRQVGFGFPLGQAVKKIYEAPRLFTEPMIKELLGAINYLAAAVIVIQETSGVTD